MKKPELLSREDVIEHAVGQCRYAYFDGGGIVSSPGRPPVQYALGSVVVRDVPDFGRPPAVSFAQVDASSAGLLNSRQHRVGLNNRRAEDIDPLIHEINLSRAEKIYNGLGAAAATLTGALAPAYWDGSLWQSGATGVAVGAASALAGTIGTQQRRRKRVNAQLDMIDKQFRNPSEHIVLPSTGAAFITADRSFLQEPVPVNDHDLEINTTYDQVLEAVAQEHWLRLSLWESEASLTHWAACMDRSRHEHDDVARDRNLALLRLEQPGLIQLVKNELDHADSKVKGVGKALDKLVRWKHAPIPKFSVSPGTVVLYLLSNTPEPDELWQYIEADVQELQDETEKMSGPAEEVKRLESVWRDFNKLSTEDEGLLREKKAEVDESLRAQIQLCLKMTAVWLRLREIREYASATEELVQIENKLVGKEARGDVARMLEDVVRPVIMNSGASDSKKAKMMGKVSQLIREKVHHSDETPARVAYVYDAIKAILPRLELPDELPAERMINLELTPPIAEK